MLWHEIELIKFEFFSLSLPVSPVCVDSLTLSLLQPVQCVQVDPVNTKNRRSLFHSSAHNVVPSRLLPFVACLCCHHNGNRMMTDDCVGRLDTRKKDERENANNFFLSL